MLVRGTLVGAIAQRCKLLVALRQQLVQRSICGLQLVDAVLQLAHLLPLALTGNRKCWSLSVQRDDVNSIMLCQGAQLLRVKSECGEPASGTLLTGRWPQWHGSWPDDAACGARLGR